MVSAAFSGAVVGKLREDAPSDLIDTPEFWVMLVAIAPGNTTVTRTLVSRSSEYSPSVSSLTDAFDAP